MLSDSTAELWEVLRTKGRILRSEDPDDWSYAHDEGVTEDLRTLAAAQDLIVVEAEDGLWLTATAGSRYALRPGDVMRGSPDRETRVLVSHISLLVLSRLLDPSRISSSPFVTLEGIVGLMDGWADKLGSSESVTDESRQAASIWRGKPLSDGSDEDAGQRANATTKRGIALYAIHFLEAVDLLDRMSDQRWRASMRAVALWPRFAEVGEFASALRDRGMELGVDDYA